MLRGLSEARALRVALFVWVVYAVIIDRDCGSATRSPHGHSRVSRGFRKVVGLPTPYLHREKRFSLSAAGCDSLHALCIVAEAGRGAVVAACHACHLGGGSVDGSQKARRSKMLSVFFDRHITRFAVELRQRKKWTGEYVAGRHLSLSGLQYRGSSLVEGGVVFHHCARAETDFLGADTPCCGGFPSFDHSIDRRHGVARGPVFCSQRPELCHPAI